MRAPRFTFLVLIAGLLVGGSVVWAEEEATPAAPKTVCPICGRVTNDNGNYASTAGTTLVRGGANTLFGWTELIRQPANEVKSGGNVVTGIAKGVGHTVTRTVAGVAEILTFWAPKHRGIHLVNDCPLCMKGK
ncbi:MAG: exosortase system-associated protein, TIGR04073 family [Candidatus Omnitrophica bacterium]|nr:exosortase system-associated protein, TIGR04073 family [Candidatus Omnitrophota bacterium]